MLGVIDPTTRWVEAGPLCTLIARETCHALIIIIQHISIPLLVISDNGTNFIAERRGEMYDRLDLELRTSASHAPFVNEKIERCWVSLKHMLHHVIVTDDARSTFHVCCTLTAIS